MIQRTRPDSENAPTTRRRGSSNGVVIVVALLLLTSVHLLVDLFAGTILPLWPAFEEHMGVGTGGALWAFVAWSIATSFSQLAFGFWADRGQGRWLVWWGAALAVICLSCVGLAGSVGSLSVLLVFGGLGVAAFHPEAAAMAGELMPTHRSRVMAIFGLGGYFGQAIGPYYSGALTERLGLPGLLWGIAWGGSLLLVLAAASILSSASVTPPRERPERRSERRTVGVSRMIILLVIGSLRIIPAIGVPLALVYMLRAQEEPLSVIGAVQSAFMVGIGIGGMICAILISQRWERLVLWFVPVAAAPILLFLDDLEGAWLMAAVTFAGFFHGIGMPVYISYGQQLLPGGQRVASSITMGACWGVAGALVAVIVGYYQRLEILPSTLWLFAIISAASGLLCLRLPRTAGTIDK